MPMKRWAGKRLLLLVAMGGLLSSCAATPCKSPYQVVVPTLQAAPVPLACLQGIQATHCLLLLEEDWRRVVRELKAACLAAGGDTEYCHTQAIEINNLSIEQNH